MTHPEHKGRAKGFSGAPEPSCEEPQAPSARGAGKGAQLLSGSGPTGGAEPYAVIRDHVGVVPVTRHNARYSGIGGV